MVPPAIDAARAARGLSLCLLVRGGSKSYGIDGPGSDDDYAGVFLPTLRAFVSLDGPGPDSETGNAPDFTLHELGKFCRLALKGNPAVLEVLWNEDVIEVDAWGRELRERRKSFLHRDGLGVYVSYAESQLKKMARGGGLHAKGGTYNGKFGAHLIRLLHSGITLAATGEVQVRVPPPLAVELLAIKNGQVSMERVIQDALPLLERLTRLAATNTLPAAPDTRAIDDLVARARMSR
ncbi:MAG TPA: nucleotidyltransferase domain-containing protein [Planctomycetota bacterium]